MKAAAFRWAQCVWNCSWELFYLFAEIGYLGKRSKKPLSVWMKWFSEETFHPRFFHNLACIHYCDSVRYL
jgi:hypothetical protein